MAIRSGVVWSAGFDPFSACTSVAAGDAAAGAGARSDLGSTATAGGATSSDGLFEAADLLSTGAALTSAEEDEVSTIDADG
jgi:hypothetical protein